MPRNAGKKRDLYPEVGEYVIGTVQNIFKQGAFISLDEYGDKRGMLPLSEISLKWVRNIRDYVKENQKVVLIVLGVNKDRGHIDLSLRRVTESRRKEKLQQLKRLQRAIKLFEVVEQELELTKEDVKNDIEDKLLDEYNTAYDGLEAIAIDETVADKLELDSEWKDKFVDLVKKNIKPPFVYVTGYVELKSYQPDGVEILRDSLKKIEKYKTDKDSSIEVNYITPPLYKIKVRSKDYKTAEKILKEASDEGIRSMEKKKGVALFHRNIENKK